MRAEHAAVDVRLVDDDIFQAAKALVPEFVVRQDAHMQHIRVGDEQPRTAPYAAAFVAWRIAVEDVVSQP